jgi:hypothetical protein
MKWETRNRFWLGGCVGLALAVAAPTVAQATQRGGEPFDRRGAAYDRSDGSSTWRRDFHRGWGRGEQRDARAGRGQRGAVPSEVRRDDANRPGAGSTLGGGGSGDPQTPEPTAALLFGAGLLAIRRAARKGRAR